MPATLGVVKYHRTNRPLLLPMPRFRNHKPLATLMAALLVAPFVAGPSVAGARTDGAPPAAIAPFAAVVPEATQVRRGRRYVIVRRRGPSRGRERVSLPRARSIVAVWQRAWRAVSARGPPY
jgi:hypothetical protein